MVDMEQTADYFLVIDSHSQALRGKMQVSGVVWEGKSLKSKMPNWIAIAELAESEKCQGIILTLNEQTYTEVSRTFEERCYIDESVVQRLFEAVGRKPHLVLAHEALVGGAALYDHAEDSLKGEADDDDEEPDWYMPPRDYFGDIDEEMRVKTHERLDAWGIELFAYKRNVEAEQLASHFVEDANSNLILRIYVPNGQLYQDETEQLFGIFHKWLTSIKKVNVRKDGYSSGKGSVVEFRAASRDEVQIFHAEIPQFRKFVFTLSDVKAAELMLSEYGIASPEASKLVSEFSRSFRRLDRDARRQHEIATLELRYQLEEELSEELLEVDPRQILEIVGQVIPSVSSALRGDLLDQGPAQVTVNKIENQQIIQYAEGIVAQNMSGTAVLSQGAMTFESLITNHAPGIAKQELIQALRELDDEAAPDADRVKAKGKLRTYLASIADKVGGAAIQLGLKYLESQLGI